MDNIEHRVIKLEYVTDTHEQDLKELRDTSRELSATLAGIQDNLKQIKWMATGAALVFIANEMGLIKLLKTILF
jgi:hypothetical protein